MRFSFKHLLLFVVFLTGAAVLIVEIVATRILSPYFGNTIYTYSSVIGVVLAALSLGYYFGGRIADRKPDLRLFFFIIFASGLTIFLLGLLTVALMPLLGYRFSIISGPVVSALFLFFLPSVLLGMLSPFAIKLVEKYSSKKGVGTISGLVFFWSTLGSIFGSFFAGFYLIPNFEIQQIIFWIGSLLTLMGIIGLYFAGIKKKLLIKLILTGLMIASGLFFSVIFNDARGAVYVTDGVYERISIIDREYNGRPTRFFNQDRSFSGAMFLDSDELVYDYTKYFALYKVFNPRIKDVLVIGGGAYSIPKAYLQESSDLNVDVVEIEPSLFSLAREYFRVPDDPRLTNYIQDGRRFLYDSQKKYDVIFSDVFYSLYSIPSHFTTLEFFELVRNRLNDDGIFIANLIGSLSRQKPSILFSEINTFKKVFPNVYLFATESPKKHDSQNQILVGFKSEKIIDLNNSNIINNPDPILSGLAGKFVDLNRFSISAYPIFTDNYSPVEYFTAVFLSRRLNENYKAFNSREALALIDQQLSFGPRFLTSEGHKLIQNFLISELAQLSDDQFTQEWYYTTADGKQTQMRNIVSRFFPEKEKRILIGTHYDSKRFSDQDQGYSTLPVPGANDSASGTAVLLELAHVLANVRKIPNVGVDLVFFDGEEGEEDLSSVAWMPIGSSYFADNLEDMYPKTEPELVIVIDMVCDRNLTFYKEGSSFLEAPELVDDFWKKANVRYPDVFIPEIRYEISDDHSPFLDLGIPAILIIDFDYDYFHTTEDTLDKCSRESLDVLGNVLFDYIYSI